MTSLAAQGRVRDSIYQQGVRPDLAADVWQLARASHRANLRWRPNEARWSDTDPDERSEPQLTTALVEVPVATAPFCHDVLLYRAFIAPTSHEAARRWLGPAMWSLIEALGGWPRVHGMPLGRLHEEAAAALVQIPSFLRPPSYPLRPLPRPEAWAMAHSWVGKYPGLARLSVDDMVGLQLTAGAWLWVFHRTDAEVQRGGGSHRNLAGYIMRLGRHVAELVGLGTRARLEG